MEGREVPFWRRASAVFHDRAAEYDQWFEDSLLFRIELDALREVRTDLAGPRCEVGIGPGRFAVPLGVDFGVDPAWGALVLARARGRRVCRAVGEMLPMRDQVFGTVFLLFALCFVEHPRMMMAECRRVLRPGGHLVLGMVPSASPWGRMLAAKREKGHPFYRHAAFFDPEEVRSWLAGAGFELAEARSSLRQPPERLAGMEASEEGISPEAGFVVLVGRRGV